MSLNVDPDADATVEEKEEEEAAVEENEDDEAAVEENEDEMISSYYRQSMIKLVQGIWG